MLGKYISPPLAFAFLILTGCEGSASKEVNQPPTFTSNTVIKIQEHTSLTTTVTASDPNGDDLTYAITGGEDADLFDINTSTGEITSAIIPNYDEPKDVNGDNIFEIIISVKDSTSTPSSTALTIEVYDVDRAIPVLLFPLPNSELGAASVINVMGSIASEEDSNKTIHNGSISVNGIPAPFLEGYPGIWSATIPLQQGSNHLDITYEGADGYSTTVSKNVSNNPVYYGVIDFTFDETNNIFYFYNDDAQSFISMDGNTEEISTIVKISDFITEPADVHSMHFDSSENLVYFLRKQATALYAFSVTNGEIRIISDTPLNSEFENIYPKGFTIDRVNGKIFLIDDIGVISVTLANGHRRYIYKYADSNQFGKLSSVYYDNDSQQLFITPDSTFNDEGLDDGLYALDTDNATITEVAPACCQLRDDVTKILAVNGDIAYLNSPGAIREVNLSTGNRTVLYTPKDGENAYHKNPNQSHYFSKSKRKLYSLVASPKNQIKTLQFDSSDSSILFDYADTVSTGPIIESIWGIDIDQTNNRVIAINNNGGIFSISLVDGQRTQIADEIDAAILPKDLQYNSFTDSFFYANLFFMSNSAGALFEVVSGMPHVPTLTYSTFSQHPSIPEYIFYGISSMVLDEKNQRILFSLNGSSTGTYWLDLTTQTVTVLQQRMYEAWETSFEYLQFSSLDLAGDRVIASDFNSLDIKSINLTNGQDTLIYQAPSNSLPPLQKIDSTQLDAINNRILISDSGMLFWLNLDSGEREIASGGSIGNGPTSYRMYDLELDDNIPRAFYTSNNRVYMLNTLTGDRAVISN